MLIIGRCGAPAAFFIAALTALGTPALAAKNGAAPLTPERVFSDPDISGPDARGVQLSPDGKTVAFLRSKEEDQTALDLWTAPADGTGPARRLVDSAALEAPRGQLSEAEKGRRERQRISEHGVIEYAFDEAGRRILTPASGALYVADVRTGAVVQRVSKGAEDGAATDAKFSPKGGYVSFVRDGALMIAPTAEGPLRAVTPKAQGAVSYGVAEFVAQEEFARDTGYWWSPNDDAIAYTRVDESKVDIVQRVDLGAAGTQTITQKYPRAGGVNARVDLFVQVLAGGAPVLVDLGADEDFYLVHAAWSADGGVLYVERQTRDQTTLDLLAVDPSTGRSTIILSEHKTPWVAVSHDFKPLKDGSFLWTSERTGYLHLYLYDRGGALIRAVTSGDFPLGGLDRVRSVVGVDEARGQVYVIASRESALEQHLYAVDYRHGGPMVPLTSGHGWWTVSMGQSADAFVGRYSDAATPPHTGLYSIDGTLRRWIVENRLDAGHPYAPFRAGLPKPTFGQVSAEDGQALDYILLKPTNFDPKKRYPAIVEVYGGPGRQKVSRAWRNPEERLWLEAGFVIFQLDNRGAANRGLRFEAPIYKHLGGPEVRDQILGLRTLQALPFVDKDRVGVMGWSYGGFMTWRLLTEPGSGFAAGAAGAAPAAWGLYDTHYTEQYMGRPQDDPAAYTAAALLPRLEQLHTPILMLHGMADDNVLFENATALMARLQELGKPFDLMTYPGQRHVVVGTLRRRHLFETELRFFQRTLGSLGSP